MKLLKELLEGAMKRSDPYVSGEKEPVKPARMPKPADKKPKGCGTTTRATNLAKKAGVSVDKVMAMYKHAKAMNNSYAAVWASVQRELNLREEVEDEGDDHDDGSYERENKVELLILRAFRKCGLKVAENEHSRGPKDHDDHWHFDVLYSEDDFEASVTVEEAELSEIVKLHGSGLFEGECRVTATSDMALRFVFTVHPALRDGEASIS